RWRRSFRADAKLRRGFAWECHASPPRRLQRPPAPPGARPFKKETTMPTFFRLAAALASCLLAAACATAQVPQYGPNVTQDQAHKAIAGALAEARKINVPMAIAVVDTAGQLVAFERMDNTQTGSIA